MLASFSCSNNKITLKNNMENWREFVNLGWAIRSVPLGFKSPSFFPEHFSKFLQVKLLPIVLLFLMKGQKYWPFFDLLTYNWGAVTFQSIPYRIFFLEELYLNDRDFHFIHFIFISSFSHFLFYWLLECKINFSFIFCFIVIVFI